MRRCLAALVLTLAIAMSRAAEAATDAIKDPLSYPLKWYGLVLGVSVFGGFVAWFRRVKRGELLNVHIRELIGELATSAFAGLLTFWVCESMGVPLIVTAPMAGVAGHMGGRAIDMLETHLLKRAGFTADRRGVTRPAPLDDGRE